MRSPRRRVTAFVLGLGLLLIVAGSVAAQSRGNVVGQVREASSGKALAGAQVYIPGTGIGSLTNADGQYTLAGVPVGPQTIRIQMIGYATADKRVTVAPSEAVTVNFDLAQSAVALDQIVVTGAGVATEKKKLGNTIATVNVDAIKDAPTTNFSQVLAARQPGIQVLPSGGLTGEGARIRIRGAASISQSNEPVVYLNGVRVDNSGGFAAVGTGGGGTASRLDDIDPASIERIEILKGAAAATLYGSEASAGVIQIFTKRGAVGAPSYEIQLEQGFSQYPDVWKPNAGFARTAAQAQTINQLWGLNVQPFQVFEVNPIQSLVGTGNSQTISGSVNGGSSAVTYFVSGRYAGEDGPIKNDLGAGNDKDHRVQATLNLGVSPRDNLQLRLSSSYADVVHHTINNNNNIYAPMTLAMFSKPETADCNKSSIDAGTGRCTGQGNSWGAPSFATTPEGFNRAFEQGVQHYNGSLGANWRPVEDLTLDATFGVDLVTQHDAFAKAYGWNIDGRSTNDPQGSRDATNRIHREISIDAKAAWDRRLNDTWANQFLAGVQGFVRREDYNNTYGSTFPGPGFDVTGALAVQNDNERFESVVNAGVFFQDRIEFQRFTFLTVGGRYDKNSAFGKNTAGAFYPKVSLSLVPSDRPGWSSTMFSTVRLRAAVGQSGLQPGAFDKLTTYSSIRAPGSTAAVTPFNLGDPDLKPEVSTEYEAGLDLGLLHNRVEFGVTAWTRTTKDALVPKLFPVSGGFLNKQLANIGELQAHGVELNASGQVHNGSKLAINVFANGSFLREKVTDMGGAPPLKAGDAYPRYRNYIKEGYAPGAFFGPVLRNTEFPIDINGDCQPDSKEALLQYFSQPRGVDKFDVLVENGDPRPCGGGTDFKASYLGKPNPDWAGSFGADFTVFRNWKLAGLFEYKAGNFFVHNLTDGFRRSNSSIGRNLRGAAETEAALLNPATSAEDRLTAAVEWAKKWTALSPFDGLNEVEKADFLRLREVSITFLAPRSLAAKMGANSLSITASGRNLALITGYSGLDPEINLLGRSSPGVVSSYNNNYETGIEAFGIPLPRLFLLSVRAGF